MIKFLKYFIVIIVTLTSSCSSFKQGIFETICLRYHNPEIKIAFYSDHTFEYFIPYVEEKVVGKWHINKGILTLESELFDKPQTEFSIIYKYTEAIGKDVYKMSGNKLFIMSADGSFTNKCYLKKVSNIELNSSKQNETLMHESIHIKELKGNSN